MKNHRFVLVAGAAAPLLVCPGGLTSRAVAQPAMVPEGVVLPVNIRAPGAEDSELPSIKEATEGFSVVNNNQDRGEATFIGLYRKDNTLLASIAPAMLGKDWLLSSTMSAGRFLTGFQLGSTAVQWRRNGDTLALYEPELRYTASAGGPQKANIKRTYTDRFILSAPIKAEDIDGTVLIDLSSVLTGASGDLNGPIGSLGPEGVSIASAKAFAKNLEVSFSGPAAFPLLDGQVQTLSYSLSALPEPGGFEMREADTRVGYWVHAKRDVGKRSPLESNFTRTIERWRLRKANPEMSMSPPVEPIVFYIEKSVPPQYRLYVRRGIEAWNEAFEAVGIENAIEVRQQTETRHADIDPEDVRYNFVRWITTGGGFAIALHRTDPRTGEILDADVLIDDSWVNVWTNEYPLLVQQAFTGKIDGRLAAGEFSPAMASALRDRGGRRGLIPPGLERALTRDEFRRLPEHAQRSVIERHVFEAEPGVLGKHTRGRMRCGYASMLGHHMAKAHLAWQASAGANADVPMLDGVPEQLIGDNLVALTAHEIGHVLGLRHNFAGSAWKPADAIETYRDPEQEPPVASVMDYVGTMIAEDPENQGLYNQVRVGAYDRWAIAYGYMGDDEDALSAHLARSVEPAHRYMTDEDVYGLDPVPMRYDLGSDPVEGRQRQLRIVDNIRSDLLRKLAREGENWAKIRSAFQTLWFEELFALWDTTGWIGGTYLYRDHNAEGNERPPMVNIDGDTQRRVLGLFTERVFSEDAYQFDRELLNHLQLEKWYTSNFGMSGFGSGEYSINSQVNLLQFFLLFDLNFIGTPRLMDQELRADPASDALTAPELQAALTDAIWSEFRSEPAVRSAPYTNLDPKVKAVRRNLQREHVEQLIDLGYRFGFFGPNMRQVGALARHELGRIRGMLENWEGAEGLDDYSKIHVADLAKAIDDASESLMIRR